MLLEMPTIKQNSTFYNNSSSFTIVCLLQYIHGQLNTLLQLGQI